jgi:hypothetical protein
MGCLGLIALILVFVFWGPVIGLLCLIVWILLCILAACS